MRQGRRYVRPGPGLKQVDAEREKNLWPEIALLQIEAPSQTVNADEKALF